MKDKGKAVRLNGNEIACLLLSHLLSDLSAKKELPQNGACIKTIVTTELFSKIAKSYNLPCFDVLTGFKYIAELIHEWEESFGGYQYLFGAEESHGYLAGTFVRDKDAISSGCLLAEAAEQALLENRTLIDRLHEIYRTHGVHRQMLKNLAFEDSAAGMEKMQKLMERLRNKAPQEIHGKKVLRIEDYLLRTSLDLTSGKKESLLLPSSDALRFWLEDEIKLVIRPSGTEPKVKIYIEGCLKPSSRIEEDIQACNKMISQILDAFIQQ